MVDALVLDSIRGMEEELIPICRRVEGVGEKERGSRHQGGHSGGRIVGRDNVHQLGKEPAGAMANDVQTLEGQAPQMARPSLEVAQDGKTKSAILHI
jgi:hypothetical protein